jgi:hypothetical protein
MRESGVSWVWLLLSLLCPDGLEANCSGIGRGEGTLNRSRHFEHTQGRALVAALETVTAGHSHHREFV